MQADKGGEVLAKNRVQEKLSINEEKLTDGIILLKKHPLFSYMDGWITKKDKGFMGKQNAAFVSSEGEIFVNKNMELEPKQWANAIAHCMLHLAFGHFDAERMPGYEAVMPDGKKEWKVTANKKIWNLACDIYVTKFLQDMKFGKPLSSEPLSSYGGPLTDELKIYQYLMEHGVSEEEQLYGTAAISSMDMKGLEKPLFYKKGEENHFIKEFVEGLAFSAKDAVSVAGGHGALNDCKSEAEEAKDWFVNHYPLLGSMAAAFKIREDRQFCMQEEISIAAIDINGGEIHINPGAYLSKEEMKFVIAHELLHAGLAHHERCQGRDFQLWNVACDFVINGWLHDMNVGTMPHKGLLYDEKYKDWSAEAIYDEIIKEVRRNKKLETFRGHAKGDILEGGRRRVSVSGGMSLDEFCKNALFEGLEFEEHMGRGFIPSGLVQEIRALAMPVIPWDVELAKWFDCLFPSVEKHHTYARPSRRQGATPDIPRPRYVKNENNEESRTFGVIIDTSGSMTANMIGMALGSIASYAAAKEVPMARVVFCDAAAYDAGYMSPEDIAGRVEVKGRGGTKLQPAIDLLQNAKNFPKNGPILIITDGYIEHDLRVKHEHAYLIPKGNRLPFKAKGKVFYFK